MRKGLYLILLAALTTASVSDAWACRCSTNNLRKLVRQADTIELAKIKATRGPTMPAPGRIYPDDDMAALSETLYTIQSNLKPGDQIQLYSEGLRESNVTHSISEAACGVRFSRDKEYLIFKNAGFTHACSGTSKMKRKGGLRRLIKIAKIIVEQSQE